MAEKMEGRTIKELRPALIYAVAATETWLEDLVREGNELLKIQYEGSADLWQHAAYFSQLLT